jgi:hypothetical protein
MKISTSMIVLATALSCVGALLDVAPRASAQNFSDWSPPVNLGPTVNSPSLDFGPAISKNGLSLYISSTRPGGFGGEDIWVSKRESHDDPWGLPVNLGPNINTNFRELVPNLSRDGHWMFFSSSQPGGLGRFDIWASFRVHTHDDFGWQPPVNLGAGVNSAENDLAPHYFANDDVGTPNLFFTRGIPGVLTDFDTYVSELQADGSFGPAVLVPELSSPQVDARPNLRHDGREIFFYSNRPGSLGGVDLWVSTRETTLDAWSTPMNLGAAVNSAFNDQHPTVFSDRETLIFASNRPGGSGDFDLYITTRTRIKGAN